MLIYETVSSAPIGIDLFVAHIRSHKIILNGLNRLVRWLGHICSYSSCNLHNPKIGWKRSNINKWLLRFVYASTHQNRCIDCLAWKREHLMFFGKLCKVPDKYQFTETTANTTDTFIHIPLFIVHKFAIAHSIFAWLVSCPQLFFFCSSPLCVLLIYSVWYEDFIIQKTCLQIK